MELMLAFVGLLVALVALGLLYRISSALQDIADELAASRRPQPTAFSRLTSEARAHGKAEEEEPPLSRPGNDPNKRRPQESARISGTAWVIAILAAIAAALVLQSVYAITV